MAAIRGRPAAQRLRQVSMAWVCAVSVISCTPSYQVSGPEVVTPKLDEESFFVSDGTRLPLSRWVPDAPPRAVVVAVHGYTDYRNAFALPAPFLAASGIAVYAYDQRGFGAAPQRGLWPGRDLMVRDLTELIRYLRRTWVDVPLFVLGDSMGAAVAITTLSDPNTAKEVQGLILNAPAVWGAETFNPFYRAGLWLLAHTIPWYETSGKGIKRTISDNRDVLIQMSQDPLLLRSVRIESLYGLVQLMDRALTDANSVQVPVLVLYGLKDEIIPLPAICKLRSLFKTNLNVAFYKDGYHLLLRDLQAINVWRDIVLWVNGVEVSAPDLVTDPCLGQQMREDEVTNRG